ncbi:hypothetical protein [Natrononativus amylolyticus]|uniref:hypothetical protein n=1 Tax=Natrononativus amylolyticus TaxID=2963434 RepID=UPI0020CF945D|nr:hypothetical protein [Natrononativus amylolyticus]
MSQSTPTPGDGDRVLEGTPRTVRRWVGSAAAELAEDDTDDRWLYVGPHDLRRTWGHLALEAEVLPSVLMQWGGWDDYETFQRHYLGSVRSVCRLEKRRKSTGSNSAFIVETNISSR